MDISLFRRRSIGIVVKNKDRDTHEVEVAPIEDVFSIDGQLTDDLTTIESEGTDSSGNTYIVSVNTSVSIPCQWLQLHGSNRITSPDVRVGEQVVIYQYGDTDVYYWVPLGMHDDLRRLETVLMGWSATSDASVELDPDTNMYTLLLSTHDNKVVFNTTMENGEAFGYTITLDTDYGSLEIIDNEGNYALMDSAERKFEIYNTDESFCRMEKTEIHSYCKDLINFKTDGDMVGHVEKDVTITVNGNVSGAVKGDVTLTVGGNADIDVEGDVTFKAPKMQFGEDGAVEPSVLGNQLAGWIEGVLKPWLDAHVHIGNLGIPTGPPTEPFAPGSGAKGGGVYSKVNTNQ